MILTVRQKALLALVVVVSAWIRLAGITSGLPSETRRLSTFHPDESVTFYSLEEMNPRKLDFFPGTAQYWGSFQVYLQGAVSEVMALTGMVKIGRRGYLLEHLKEADKLYISGRLLAMLFGAASVVVFFHVAGFFFGFAYSLLAAFLFGFTYVLLHTCFFVRPDSFMLFWGLLAVYFGFRIVKDPSRRNYAGSGVFIGLSAASKYPGGFFSFFTAWSHFYNAWRNKRPLLNFRLLLLSAVVSVGVFFIVDPYFFLRFSDTMKLIGAWTSIHWNPAIDSGFLHWRNYFDLAAYALPIAMGWPLYVFGLAGLPFLVREKTPYAAAILAFMLIYALKFGRMDSALFIYFLQLAVFLIISAVRFASVISARKAGLLLTVLMTAYTAAYAVYLKSFFWKPGTVVAAGEWIEANIPAGKTIAIPKKDIWTPPVIRQLNPPYRVIEAVSSKAPLADAFGGLPAAAERADYVVLAGPEYGPGLSGLSRERREEILSRVDRDFTLVREFAVPLNRFFVPLTTDFHNYQMKLRAPDIRIYERRRRAPRNGTI